MSAVRLWGSDSVEHQENDQSRPLWASFERENHHTERAYRTECFKYNVWVFFFLRYCVHSLTGVKGSTRCPCRVQHVPRLQEARLELIPQYFMIAIQCMRRRNIPAVYQASLANPVMPPNLGSLPPLPKNATDALFRVCSQSFDIPARVTGLAAIRAMASAPDCRRNIYSYRFQLDTLDRIVYFCGIFNIPFPIYRLPWPLLTVEMEWLAGSPNKSWEVSKNTKSGGVVLKCHLVLPFTSKVCSKPIKRLLTTSQPFDIPEKNVCVPILLVTHSSNVYHRFKTTNTYLI
jgi:hypothetical protein